VSGILQQDTNVRLHLRGMERCGDWASQEGASASGMFEMQDCNGLGGRAFQRKNTSEDEREGERLLWQIQ
jgi:hypothetical protein